MAPSERLKALVEQMPDPDGRGMYCTDIDKDKIDRTIADIHAGGRENIPGLIDLLVPPGEGDDVKAHYALHGLANHVLKLRDEGARRQFGETLASQLGGDRPKAVQAYLCQELQWAGRAEAVPALGKLLVDEELTEPATMALVAIKQGAAEQFRAAWPSAKGKCRLNVIHGLAALVDTQSGGIFREGLGDPDREVRLAAGAGLARTGDAGAVDLLLKAAGAEPGWERIQATKHCLVLAENLAAAGKKAEAGRIYAQLRDSRTDPAERYIREAAEKALATV